MTNLDALWAFLNNFWNSLFNAFTWVLTQVLSLVVFCIKTLLEGFFAVVLAIVNGLDFGTILSNLSANWGLVDPHIIYAINRAGLPQCLTMITYAVGIRMLLNLIPAAFTRI